MDFNWDKHNPSKISPDVLSGVNLQHNHWQHKNYKGI